MVILIAGASHTGKTALAQKILDIYRFPYLSVDHLKMGLIRSGHTALTPESDEEALTAYLWPIVLETVKTAVENRQNLTVEGCYIPFDWADGLEECYRREIRCIRLVMSEAYIRAHFDAIKSFANVIEQRLDDSDCTLESVLSDNARELEGCLRSGAAYHLIDSEYDPEAAVKALGIRGAGASSSKIRENAAVSLHDCRADHIECGEKMLRFHFPNGVCFLGDESAEEGAAEMRCRLSECISEAFSAFVYRKRFGKKVREDWSERFIPALNRGEFEFEFVGTYRSYGSILFKGYIWSEKKPYYRECELELEAEEIVYSRLSGK